MRRPPVLALVVAVLAAPTVPFADDWAYDRSSGYDVSVDLQGAVTFDTFHGSLEPYGDWVVVGSYGRVWRPRVATGWRPYYYGRWEWTNEGWLWVSDEPWGWAAYHYGRWAYDPYYGWIWVPGYEWAPAWVSWRTSGDVIGWAPLAPGFSVYVSSYPFIDFWWTFVPCVRFVSVPVYTVAYAPRDTRRWFERTAPAPARPPRSARVGPSPAPAWGGPAPRHIEERIGRPVTPARIVRAPTPGERGRPGEIPVYRPERPGRDDAVRGHGFAPRDERAAPAPGGRGGAVAPSRPPGWNGGGGERPDRPGGEQRHGAAVSPRGERRHEAAPAPAPAPSRGGWSGGGDGGRHPGWSGGGRGGDGGGRGGGDGHRGGGQGGGRAVRPEGRNRN